MSVVHIMAAEMEPKRLQAVFQSYHEEQVRLWRDLAIERLKAIEPPALFAKSNQGEVDGALKYLRYLSDILAAQARAADTPATETTR